MGIQTEPPYTQKVFFSLFKSVSKAGRCVQTLIIPRIKNESSYSTNSQKGGAKKSITNLYPMKNETPYYMTHIFRFTYKIFSKARIFFFKKF